jgi:hypothetical protein
LWKKTGFEYDQRNETICLVVNERKIRESDRFREMWLFDYHPARMSVPEPVIEVGLDQ